MWKRNLVLILAMGMPALAQTNLQCQASGTPIVVRSESLSERVGDIIIQCTGAAGAQVSGSLTVFLGVNITNHVNDAGIMDVDLSVDTGAGPVPSGVPARYVSNNSVAFSGHSVAIPSSGRFTWRITNLRGAIAMAGFASDLPIRATLAGNLPLSQSPIVVAFPQRGLLATYSSAGVRCTGSPLPSTISMSGLFAAKTRFFSTRVTEGLPNAFEVKTASADSGTRFVIRYSGFPADARLFTPEVVAGSNATEPTAGGDLGLAQSAGRYTPGGSGSLLLARVQGTDSNGAGGTPVFNPGSFGSSTIPLAAAREVPLVNGEGVAVFEVMDSNPGAFESAQIPTFLGLPPVAGGAATIAREEVSFGPISTQFSATSTAPVPRFLAVQPPSDCAFQRDCDAGYFPALVVVASRPLEYAALVDSAPQILYVQVQNGAGGLLIWTASVTYKSGSGWVTLDPQSGINNGTVRIDVFPQKVQPGIWEATLTIDSGPLSGSKTLPIRLEVKGLPEIPKPKAIVRQVANLARPASTVVAPGSLVNITGTGFSGQSLGVAFDGVSAVVLASSADRIVAQVPPALATKTSAQLEVTVDGEKSAPFPVSLAEIAPAIFPGGVLNVDYSVNSETNPVEVGGALIIYATGVLAPTPGPASVKLHDRVYAPLWAGFAPGLIGVNQLNILVPSDLPAMTTEVLVCGHPAATPDQPVCSAPVRITLRLP